VTSEFFYSRPNRILVYPSFDDKGIRIDPVSYRKKRVNAFQHKHAQEHKSESDDQPPTPGKRPSLFTIKQSPYRTGWRHLCQWNRTNAILH
jgi:hypothetical protein